jgi:hypothetical protein
VDSTPRAPVMADTTPTTTAMTATATTTNVEPAPRMQRRHYGNGFYVGIGAGAGIPTQAVREGYDPGVAVQVPIGWDSPTGPLGFRLDLGYTRFNSRNSFRSTGFTTGSAFNTSGVTTIATSDPQMWSAIADVKVRYPFSGRFRGASSGLYVVGGGGVNYIRDYNTSFALTNPEFDNSGSTIVTRQSLTRFALNGGGGVSWGIGATEVFLESRYVTTFTENRRASYVPIILGLTFR